MTFFPSQVKEVILRLRDADDLEVCLPTLELVHEDFLAKNVYLIVAKYHRRLGVMNMLTSTYQATEEIPELDLRCICDLYYQDYEIAIKALSTISVHTLGRDGSTPLHVACMSERTPVWLLQQMIDQGADLDAENGYLDTPLLAAECLAHMKVLLDNGCDVNRVTEDGRVALSDTDDLEQIELLLSYGADPNLEADDDTPLTKARSLKIVKLMMRYGGDLKHITQDGTTLLSNAVSKGRYKIVDYLIRKGVWDDRGFTIKQAVRSSSRRLVKKVVEQGLADEFPHVILEARGPHGPEIFRYLVQYFRNKKVNLETYNPVTRFIMLRRQSLVLAALEEGFKIYIGCLDFIMMCREDVKLALAQHGVKIKGFEHVVTHEKIRHAVEYHVYRASNLGKDVSRLCRDYVAGPSQLTNKAWP